jgi:alkylhydroperoxidase family enzyme
MARISLEPPSSLTLRLFRWYSRRTYGTELEPLAAQAHNLKVLRTTARYELRVERWNALDDALKGLAVMAAAAHLGCSWCMDFGYWKLATGGLPERKLAEVGQWRTSTEFSPLERAVLEYAEAMTATPIQVTDELTARLLEDLTESELVELTMMIALENERSRFNTALGLSSQGFKDRCELPSMR